MKKRLAKALAAAGVASRRACEELIFEGRVKLGGKVVLLPQTLVDLSCDHVTVDGKKVKSEEKKVYFLLHKPAGYLCTSEKKTPKSKIVLDLFVDHPYRLFTVGRLDRDTTGLIFVTNDGSFANRIIHPSFNVQKEYLAKVEEEIEPEHLKALSAGAFIEGSRVKPLSVVKVRRGTVKIIVGEGKKREVRQLLDHAGLTVKELSRIRVGSFTLGKLPLGSYRELTKKELESVFKSKESD
jgi:23S rRNA pseudouridine2605 synthase